MNIAHNLVLKLVSMQMSHEAPNHQEAPGQQEAPGHQEAPAQTPGTLDTRYHRLGVSDLAPPLLRISVNNGCTPLNLQPRSDIQSVKLDSLSINR